MLIKRRHSSTKNQQPLSNNSLCKDQLSVPKNRQDRQQNTNKPSSSIKRYFSDGSATDNINGGSTRLNLKRRVSLFKRSFSITNPFQQSSSSSNSNQLTSPSIHTKNFNSAKTLQNDFAHDENEDTNQSQSDRSHLSYAFTNSESPLLPDPWHNPTNNNTNKEKRHDDPANPPTIAFTKKLSTSTSFISNSISHSHPQSQQRSNANDTSQYYPLTPDSSTNASPIKQSFSQCSSSQNQSEETLLQQYTPESSPTRASSLTNSIRIASASTSSTGLQHRRQQRSISTRRKQKQKLTTTTNKTLSFSNCVSLVQNNDPETPTRLKKPEFSIFGNSINSQNSSLSSFTQQTSSTLFSSSSTATSSSTPPLTNEQTQSSYQWPGPWAFPPGKNVTPSHLNNEEGTTPDSSVKSTISSIVSRPTIKLVDTYNNNASNSNISLSKQEQDSSLTCDNLEDDVDGLKITESGKDALFSFPLGTTNSSSTNSCDVLSNEVSTVRVHPLLIPEIVALVIQHVDAMTPIPKELPPRRRKPMSFRHAMLLYGNREEALRAWQESRAVQPDESEQISNRVLLECPLNEDAILNRRKKQTEPKNMMACLLVNKLWYRETVTILHSSLHFSSPDQWNKFVSSNMFKSRHRFLKESYLNNTGSTDTQMTDVDGTQTGNSDTPLQHVGPFDINNPRLSAFFDSLDPKTLDFHAQLEVPNQAWSPRNLILHKVSHASSKELLESLPPWSTAKLEWLEFYTCFLLVPPPHLVAGGLLKKIALPGCPRVADPTVMMIAAQCPLLQHLDLRACALVSDNSIIQIAQKCPKLELLNVGRTIAGERITSASVDFLAKCTQITTLGMAGCHIDDWGIWELVRYRGPLLQRLSLNNCILLTNASIPRILQYTSRLSVLELRGVVGITNMVPFIMFKRWRERLGYPPPLIEGCEVFELRMREAEWALELQITKRIFKDSLDWIYDEDDGDVDYYESPLYSLALAQASQLDDNGQRKQRLIINRQRLLHKKMYFKRKLEEEREQGQMAADAGLRRPQEIGRQSQQIIQRRNAITY